MAEPYNKQEEQWWNPPEEREGLRQYVDTIRERKWMVIGCVVATTLIAILYVLTAQKQYQAETDLLVSPVSSTDTLLSQLGLISESADPTRDVQTAARLVSTNDVAKRANQTLGSSEDPRTTLKDVSVQPVAESNVVAVSATADSPEGAQKLANAFADAAIAQRTDEMHDQVDQLLTSLGSGGSITGNGSAAEEESRLRALQNAPDPTIRVETRADVPTSPSSPKPFLSIAGGILAGLVLGVAAAFASRLLDPRVRREDQLRRSFRLPILARIPLERGRRRLPLGPGQISRPVVEAYRTLRGTLEAARRDRNNDSRALLITGSSPSEGKTTTAINLATALALSGEHVILIEGDLRRPAIGEALGLTPSAGIVDVLLETTKIDDALITSHAYGPTLGFLLANHSGGWTTELFSLPGAQRMIEDAKRLADYVIIDSPPLNDVVDVLPLTRSVDDVLIVVRLGRSRLDRITRLAELLATNGVKPAGFAVIGTDRPGRFEYSYHESESSSGSSTASKTASRMKKPAEAARKAAAGVRKG
jgi:Mrp family chromosome partitioning ATPase/capsular polysaccharide biosynthesis protein